MSKPVAWKLHHHDRYYFEENADVVAIAESVGKAKGDALYSQEYVSALLADNEHLARELVARNGENEWLRKRAAELEAKDERIGELEAIATEYAGKFQKAQDANKHLVIMSNDDKKRIAELEAIRAAAEKLVRCKGRYHSEQNYRALAALFGVTTPDLPPVEGDSEAVIAELRAELEAEITNIVDSHAETVAELRAKLATPVRLPSEHELRQVACSECAGNCLELVEGTVRAAGFTVEDRQ
ncbi:hypothetical protein [Serratia marcescens]|uniref:hypothetical protein n=1 Tax=Serratia marcescens TaxID=615 RepID=UPI0020161E1A|nr:hypothetical protein [Serratia marcescens]